MGCGSVCSARSINMYSDTSGACGWNAARSGAAAGAGVAIGAATGTGAGVGVGTGNAVTVTGGGVDGTDARGDAAAGGVVLAMAVAVAAGMIAVMPGLRCVGMADCAGK